MTRSLFRTVFPSFFLFNARASLASPAKTQTSKSVREQAAACGAEAPSCAIVVVSRERLRELEAQLAAEQDTACVRAVGLRDTDAKADMEGIRAAQQSVAKLRAKRDVLHKTRARDSLFSRTHSHSTAQRRDATRRARAARGKFHTLFHSLSLSLARRCLASARRRATDSTPRCRPLRHVRTRRLRSLEFLEQELRRASFSPCSKKRVSLHGGKRVWDCAPCATSLVGHRREGGSAPVCARRRTNPARSLFRPGGLFSPCGKTKGARRERSVRVRDRFCSSKVSAETRKWKSLSFGDSSQRAGASRAARGGGRRGGAQVRRRRQVAASTHSI